MCALLYNPHSGSPAQPTYRGKVVDFEVYGLDEDDYAAVAYAAVEDTEAGAGAVEAVVLLLRYDPEGGADCYLVNDMAENEGPVVDYCPVRILDQLSPRTTISPCTGEIGAARGGPKRRDATFFDELGRGRKKAAVLGGLSSGTKLDGHRRRDKVVKKMPWMDNLPGLHISHLWSSFPALAEKGSLQSRIATNRLPAHIPDLAALEGDRRDDSWIAAVNAGYRATLIVPLLKDNEIVGTITLGRKQVQPFTDKQISLFRDFAAQATIALESTRLERQYREAQMALAHANRVVRWGS
ncbi:GAF domain-containing protein [Nitrobacteraceae bacterium AZCC 2161]